MPEPVPGASRRNYLFLQGPIGTFFSRLAARLRGQGHGVHRINLNGGDRIFWNLPGALDFRGTVEQWAEFLNDQLLRRDITDIVLFGDCRPPHRTATRLARRHGIRVHVFEEGYLRPNWVTLESGGVNRNSLMPRDPEWFKSAADQVGHWDSGVPVLSSFVRRAAEDVLYNLTIVFTAWRYPAYRTHKPWHPLVEYAAGAKRFPMKPWSKRRKLALLQQILGSAQPYYLFPLQLDADSQIRFHSPFGRMAPAIKKVIDSFANSAPADALLVITEHPLDTGLVELGRITRECAAAAGVAERVVYLQGGSPDELVRGSAGVVTVNSTMGILALTFGVPVVALGHAIYDMPGLTFQHGLDDFWSRGTSPDAAAFDAFRRVVASRTQVNGGFYSHMGLELAVAGSLARLEMAAKDYPVRALSAIAADDDIRSGERAVELMPGLVTQVWDDVEAISE
ncbi:capsule biosynthesis protein [Nevskia soli]|uniref:capsule biosynthesis protein n=1 Tax=Nevskia soli TaxID=418856 RepID=UPI0004A777D3|nr:capsular biosynthesis protein [Nevskia soli]